MENENTNIQPETNKIPLLPEKVITELTYNSITQRWLTQLSQAIGGDKEEYNKGFEKYFLDDAGKILLRISFQDKPLHHLLSSVGIKTIKARFALVEKPMLAEGDNLCFSIVLFGVDAFGNRCSAYHLGNPEYKATIYADGKEIGTVDDCIAGSLARKWITNWSSNKHFSLKLFETTYGSLAGYNYAMADFMNALYPPNIDFPNFGVWVHLAAHDHISHTPGIDPVEIMTFGLVLAGINPGTPNQLFTDGGRNNLSKAQAVSGTQLTTYYDLSLPSPPN